MLTIGWSGPSLRGRGCMLIYAGGVPSNLISVSLRPRPGVCLPLINPAVTGMST